jgi:predicted dehydrogenase
MPGSLSEQQGGLMKKYRVGLVGARRGSSLVMPFMMYPETEITALCDLDERTLADAGDAFRVPAAARFTDFDAFLASSIDIAVVATPMPYHVEQVIRAMEAGKHVLSEVTAADRLEDCERLVNAVKRTGMTYMMGENMIYYHFFRSWKQWIDQGRLGDIFYAEAEYIHEIQDLLWDKQSGQTFWRVKRPPIHYCTHSLGPLLTLMNDRIIQACGAGAGYGTMPDLGPGCVNMEVALFRTQKGAVIKILRSQVAFREPGMHYFSLYGTKGFVENSRDGGWRDEKGKLFVAGEMSREQGWQEIDCPHSDPSAPPEALKGGHGTAEYYMIRDFIDALNAGARPPIDVIRAMDFTVPGLCAQKSIQQGGAWVDVPLFG